MNRTKIGWVAVPGYVPCSEQLVAGCTPVSSACDHCYAAASAWRMAHNPNEAIAVRYRGMVTERGWTGEVRLLCDVLDRFEEAMEDDLARGELGPRRRGAKRCIFWCSMGDLFHPDVPAGFIRRAYRVFAWLAEDLHIVCTKRPERIVPALYGDGVQEGQALHNVWHLTTVENQEQAERRIPELLRLRQHGPWPVLGVSCEPLLGMVDIPLVTARRGLRPVDWVIVGGETGPGAREMDAAWLWEVIDDCRDTGVPCYVKQLGDAWAVRDSDAIAPTEHQAWPVSR